MFSPSLHFWVYTEQRTYPGPETPYHCPRRLRNVSIFSTNWVKPRYPSCAPSTTLGGYWPPVWFGSWATYNRRTLPVYWKQQKRLIEPHPPPSWTSTTHVLVIKSTPQAAFWVHSHLVGQSGAARHSVQGWIIQQTVRKLNSCPSFLLCPLPTYWPWTLTQSSTKSWRPNCLA